MHLSLLSDGFLSDSLRDHGGPMRLETMEAGRLHRDGVLRGLVFAAALAAPFLLAFGLSIAKDSVDGRVAQPITSLAGIRTASIHLSR